MVRRRDMTFRLPALCILIGAVLTGCLSTSSRAPGYLHFALDTNPSTLDPARWADVSSGRLMALLYSTLVRLDARGRIVGDLAESWSLSPDGTTYRFSLHPAARFANGRKVTSADVLFSFDRILDPSTGSPRTWVLDRVAGAAGRLAGKSASVEGLVALDDRTVEIRLTAAFAPFIHFLTMPSTSIVPREEVQKWGRDFTRHPMGSGPFHLERWVSDSVLDFAANKDYFRGTPKVAGIRFRIIKESLTRVSEFRIGNLDVTSIPAQQLDFFRSSPKWNQRIIEQPGLNVYYLGLNCEKPPLDRPRVRRAIAQAIDTAAILDTVRKGQGIPAVGPIPPGLQGYDPGLKGIPHDLEAARKVLGGPDIPEDFVLEIIQKDAKDNLDVTQILESYLTRAGLKCTIRSYEWSTFKQRVNEGRYGAYYLSWWADYADAENFLFPLFHSSQSGSGGNGPRYKDPEVDAMLEQARRTTDDEERVALYRKIQRKVVDDASRVYLFHKTDMVVTQPWVRGLELYPIFNGNRYTDVSIDESELARQKS